MPKEEKKIDPYTGRVRRKAVFENAEIEDEESEEEEEDEEMLLEEDEDGTDGEEEKGEEGNQSFLDQERLSKRLKKDNRATETELPAFADSDDNLEMSSDEEAVENIDLDDTLEEVDGDGQEGEDDSVEDSETISGNTELLNRPKHIKEDKVLRNSSRKVTLTTDSGNCSAEEASASDLEGYFSLEEEESMEDFEPEDSDGEDPQAKSPEVKISESKHVENDDVENLLKEEEEYKEVSDLSIDTAGMNTILYYVWLMLSLSISFW